MTRLRNNAKISLHMQKAMAAQPQTYAQLSQISGLSVVAVRYWIKALRDLVPRPIHIAGYDDDARGRPMVLKFAWGTKPDAPRPGHDKAAPARRMAAMRARRKSEAP